MSSRYYTKRLVLKRPKKGRKLIEKPRSFKSESAAKAWAEKQKITGYRIEAIAEGSKFKIRKR
jgi:hypothetical protein